MDEYGTYCNRLLQLYIMSMEPYHFVWMVCVLFDVYLSLVQDLYCQQFQSDLQ